MARKKTTTRKPAARKRPTAAAARSGSMLGRMGWMAAVAIGLGWAATDGRALSYVMTPFSPDALQTAGIAPRLPPDPQARSDAKSGSIPNPEHAPRRKASERAAIPPLTDEPTTRVAAITPSPAPRGAPVRLPREAVAPTRPSSAASSASSRMDPIAATIAAARSEPAATMRAPTPPASVVPGGERHATRRLDMRAGPEDAAAVVARIDTGTMVRVVRSSGRWRYVKSGVSNAEGWVDGTFLAGESAPEPQSAAREVAPARLVVRQADAGRNAAPSSAPRFSIAAPVPPEGFTRAGQ